MAILKTAEGWTKADLLSPAVWVTPADISHGASWPPLVSATQLTSQGAVHISDLHRFISKWKWEHVRIICGQLVTNDMDGAVPTLSPDAAMLAETISPVLAQSSSFTTSLHRVNAVIPTSGVHGLTPALLLPQWDVNVVIAAEDRPDSSNPSTYVRLSSNDLVGSAIGHATTALAVLGGIVVGVDSGPFDELPPGQSTMNGEEVQLIRCAVRRLCGPDPEAALTAVALQHVAESPEGPIPYLADAKAPTDRKNRVDVETVTILNRAPWKCTDKEQITRLLPNELGFRAASKSSASAVLSLFGTVPRWTVLRLKKRLEDSATSFLLGAETDAVVRFRPLEPAEIVAKANSDLLRYEDALGRTETAIIEEPTEVIDPHTWGDLRDLIFSFADGADRPVGAGKASGPVELIPVQDLVPDPSTKIRPIGARHSARPGDLASAQQVMRDLCPNLVISDELDIVGLTELLDSELETEDPDLKIGREQFRTWLASQTPTVLTKLQDDLRERTAYCKLRRAELSRESQIEPPSPTRLIVRFSQLVNKWRVGFVVCLVLLAWQFAAWLGYLTSAPDPIRTINGWFANHLPWTSIATIGALIIWIALANLAYHRDIRSYASHVDIALRKRSELAQQRIYFNREQKRLEQLQTALSDWIQIIGYVLHHPFGDVAVATEVVTDPILDSLPAAFAVAEVNGDSSVRLRTVAQAIRLLYPKGWSKKAFEQANLAFQQDSLAVDSIGLVAADADYSGSRIGPRAELLRFWSSGRAAQALTEQAVGDVREAVIEGDLVLPTRAIKRIGEFATGKSLAESGFYLALTEPAPAFGLEHFTEGGFNGEQYVDRSVLWLPRVAEILPETDAIRINTGGDNVALRVDLSSRLAPSDLKLFQFGKHHRHHTDQFSNQGRVEFNANSRQHTAPGILV